MRAGPDWWSLMPEADRYPPILDHLLSIRSDDGDDDLLSIVSGYDLLSIRCDDGDGDWQNYNSWLGARGAPEELHRVSCPMYMHMNSQCMMIYFAEDDKLHISDMCVYENGGYVVTMIEFSG